MGDNKAACKLLQTCWKQIDPSTLRNLINKKLTIIIPALLIGNDF